MPQLICLPPSVAVHPLGRNHIGHLDLVRLAARLRSTDGRPDGLAGVAPRGLRRRRVLARRGRGREEVRVLRRRRGAGGGDARDGFLLDYDGRERVEAVHAVVVQVPQNVLRELVPPVPVLGHLDPIVACFEVLGVCATTNVS